MKFGRSILSVLILLLVPVFGYAIGPAVTPKSNVLASLDQNLMLRQLEKAEPKEKALKFGIRGLVLSVFLAPVVHGFFSGVMASQRIFEGEPYSDVTINERRGSIRNNAIASTFQEEEAEPQDWLCDKYAKTNRHLIIRLSQRQAYMCSYLPEEGKVVHIHTFTVRIPKKDHWPLKSLGKHFVLVGGWDYYPTWFAPQSYIDEGFPAVTKGYPPDPSKGTPGMPSDLGEWWIRLRDPRTGVNTLTGLHGTLHDKESQATIGEETSKGCYAFAKDSLNKLVKMIGPGDFVTIIR